MDNPNLTMDEYIRLEEEKAHKHGKVFNWRTGTYGKIRIDDDFYDLRSMEAEFPAIVVNDDFAPKDTLQCKSQVSIPVNDELDFRISFDESDDEDCTNEFPAIVYNDAQTSKSDFSTEPVVIPQHIDEFYLKAETSFSKCDEEEQNVLNFNDLFSFNVIYPNDSKSDKDNDDDKVDIEHSSEELSVKPLPDVINVDVGAYAHGLNQLLETIPLILGRPFLSIARAKIDVYKRKITLRVEEERIIFKSVKPASSLIKRVYMLSLRERMELDLEARLMGETLVLNRSLDPFLEDYIELNDLNEPFKLRINQGDDLMPTIKEGEVIEKFRTRDEDLDTGIDDYPSYWDDDKKIHIDFLEDMDAYRDEGMDDIIVGEPFLREVRIKTKRFEGKITLYNGDDEVTYQMVRSHPRFKNHTNEQCKKIPPLLKVSEKDVKNGISHAYQNHKGFYKGVLNLGPDYVRNAKTEEWLTRGHISVHELE
ncbi:hypothetical protein Tco_1173260 [Tanacetum coccineum]